MRLTRFQAAEFARLTDALGMRPREYTLSKYRGVVTVRVWEGTREIERITLPAWGNGSVAEVSSSGENTE